MLEPWKRPLYVHVGLGSAAVLFVTQKSPLSVCPAAATAAQSAAGVAAVMPSEGVGAGVRSNAHLCVVLMPMGATIS